MLPAIERLHVYNGDELLAFTSLPKEEREEISKELLTRATDTYMGAQGYKRVSEPYKKSE